jgi:photosystem II stability/assembly factor-like uncharacterized protein
MAGNPRRRGGDPIALALACATTPSLAACIAQSEAFPDTKSSPYTMGVRRTIVLLVSLLAAAPRPAGATTNVSLHRWESFISYHPIDAGRGWVLTNRKLLVTDDGGTTWIDATPPGLHRSIQHAGVDFLDADHAWLAVAGSPRGGSHDSEGVVRVWRTRDGGGFWSVAKVPLAESPPFGVYAAPRFGSFDLSHGWMLVGEPGNTGFDHGALLYVTHDGGARWRYVAHSPAGYGDTAFSSPTAGVASGGAMTQQVWRTTDAGRSWSEIRVRRPPACPRRRAVSFLAPTVVGSTLLLGEECEQRRRNHVPVLIMSSTNGGASWRRVGRLPPNTGSPIFASVSIWIGSGERVGFKISEDAGVVWRTFRAPRRACPGWMDALSFLSPDTAWTTVGTVDGNDPTCDRPFRLFGTSDGGEHWTPLLSRRP